MQLRRGLVRRIALPGLDRRGNPLAVGAEARRQRLEEGDARAGGQLGVADEDLARECHAGSLAAPGEEVLAQLNQALRALGAKPALLARAVHEGTAAIGNRLQQLPEEGNVHLPVPAAHGALGLRLRPCRI